MVLFYHSNTKVTKLSLYKTAAVGVHASIYLGAGDLNLGPYSCTISIHTN